jgi:hypothetical protein
MSNNLTPEILERYREMALWYGELSATEIIERLVAAESTVARVEKVRAEAFRPGDDWHGKVVLECHLAAALKGGA